MADLVWMYTAPDGEGVEEIGSEIAQLTGYPVKVRVCACVCVRASVAVHITTATIRDTPANKVSLGHLGHPGQIGVGWVTQNDVTMEAVRADDYFPTPL